MARRRHLSALSPQSSLFPARYSGSCLKRGESEARDKWPASNCSNPYASLARYGPWRVRLQGQSGKRHHGPERRRTSQSPCLDAVMPCELVLSKQAFSFRE